MKQYHVKEKSLRLVVWNIYSVFLNWCAYKSDFLQRFYHSHIHKHVHSIHSCLLRSKNWIYIVEWNVRNYFPSFMLCFDPTFKEKKTKLFSLPLHILIITVIKKKKSLKTLISSSHIFRCYLKPQNCPEGIWLFSASHLTEYIEKKRRPALAPKEGPLHLYCDSKDANGKERSSYRIINRSVILKWGEGVMCWYNAATQ